MKLFDNDLKHYAVDKNTKLMIAVFTLDFGTMWSWIHIEERLRLLVKDKETEGYELCVKVPNPDKTPTVAVLVGFTDIEEAKIAFDKILKPVDMKTSDLNNLHFIDGAKFIKDSNKYYQLKKAEADKYLEASPAPWFENMPKLNSYEIKQAHLEDLTKDEIYKKSHMKEMLKINQKHLEELNKQNHKNIIPPGYLTKVDSHYSDFLTDAAGKNVGINFINQMMKAHNERIVKIYKHQKDQFKNLLHDSSFEDQEIIPYRKNKTVLAKVK